MSSAFTVHPQSLVARQWVHTLRGTKLSTISTITLNGVSGRVTTPTATSWKAEVLLSPGDNVFELRGTDVVSNTSETMEVTVTLPVSAPVPHEVMNDLRKHAAFQGLTRLPGEKNIYLHRRVSDAPYYPASATYDGLVNGISRALGLTIQRGALTVTLKYNSYQDPVSQSLFMEVTPSHILLDANELTVDNEIHQVDPGSAGFTLTYEPRYETDVQLFTRDNTRIDVSAYRVHLLDRRVIFKDNDYDLSWVRVRYNYRHSIAISGSLGTIKTALEALTIRGVAALTVTCTDTTLTAYGLSQSPRYRVSDETTSFDWTPVQIYALPDQRFRESLYNTYGAAYNTVLEAWADDIARRSKFGWGAVILDVDTWDPFYSRRNNATLPHLLDSYRGHWRCEDPSDTNRYTYSEFIGYGGNCPNHPSRGLTYVGIDDNEWHSGIGDGDDLKVTGIVAQ